MDWQEGVVGRRTLRLSLRAGLAAILLTFAACVWAVLTPGVGAETPKDGASAPSATTPVASPSAPAPKVHESFVAPGTEPSIAADPFHPGVVAVVSENLTFPSGHICSQPAVRISQDGGVSWRSATYPWGPLCEGIHAVIAWGPGGRLWATDAVGLSGGMAVSVTYSGNLGKTWAKPYVERRTPAWVGCYPSIAVDNNPGSTDLGSVYVAFNWPESSQGPGVAVMASVDGKTWAMTKVPVVTLTSGYPAYDRIGYHITPVRDDGSGVSAWVSFYQADLQSWNPKAVLDEGSSSNVGRRVLAVTDLVFDHVPGRKPTLTYARGGTSIAISSKSLDRWQTSLAWGGTDDGRTWWAAGSANGAVLLAHHLPDGQIATRRLTLPGKSSFKPSIAAASNIVFVGWHATDSAGRVWTYYSLSYDGGQTFSPPALVTKSTWFEPTVLNGVGLRENACIGSGVIYYAYGDNRAGTGIYVARIQP